MQRTPPFQTPSAQGTTSTPVMITRDSPSFRSKRMRRNSTPPSQFSLATLNPDNHEEVMAMLTRVLFEVTESRKENSELKKTMDFYVNRCEEMNDRIVILEAQKTARDTHIRNLENRLEETERHARSTSIEIRGVPSKAHESKQDLCNIIEKLQVSTKMDVQPNAIKDIYRIRGRSNEERPIIVDFATTIIKSNTLQAVKKYNSSNTTNRLNTNTLGFEQKKTPVFVSEFLTPKAKRLFFLARDLAKTDSYDFCWSTNGRIFLRKKEGAAPLLISSEQQLEELKQKNT